MKRGPLWPVNETSLNFWTSIWWNRRSINFIFHCFPICTRFYNSIITALTWAVWLRGYRCSNGTSEIPGSNPGQTTCKFVSSEKTETHISGCACRLQWAPECGIHWLHVSIYCQHFPLLAKKLNKAIKFTEHVGCRRGVMVSVTG